jgi:hypothetical protein
MAAGAKTVSQIVLEPVGSDNETSDQFNFDADSEGSSDEEMTTEPEEPQVEREKTPVTAEIRAMLWRPTACWSQHRATLVDLSTAMSELFLQK